MLVLTSCDSAPSSSDYIHPPYLEALPNSTGIFLNGNTIIALTPDGTAAWRQTIPSGAAIAKAATAPNSTTYVRTAKALHAFIHSGDLMWTYDKIKTPKVSDATILTPTALSDSSVAIVVSPQEVRNIGPNGTQRWNTVIPNGQIISQPVACQNGLLLIGTTYGVYGLSPKGHINWMRPIGDL